ncbi:MAG: hypothetical protein HQK52_09175 [Oligoflexia bacterium]|nr:hypothetical protein [Oligoflexia bacterium]
MKPKPSRAGLPLLALTLLFSPILVTAEIVPTELPRLHEMTTSGDLTLSEASALMTLNILSDTSAGVTPLTLYVTPKAFLASDSDRSEEIIFTIDSSLQADEQEVRDALKVLAGNHYVKSVDMISERVQELEFQAQTAPSTLRPFFEEQLRKWREIQTNYEALLAKAGEQVSLETRLTQLHRFHRIFEKHQLKTSPATSPEFLTEWPITLFQFYASPGGRLQLPIQIGLEAITVQALKRYQQFMPNPSIKFLQLNAGHSLLQASTGDIDVEGVVPFLPKSDFLLEDSLQGKASLTLLLTSHGVRSLKKHRGRLNLPFSIAGTLVTVTAAATSTSAIFITDFPLATNICFHRSSNGAFLPCL